MLAGRGRGLVMSEPCGAGELLLLSPALSFLETEWGEAGDAEDLAEAMMEEGLRPAQRRVLDMLYDGTHESMQVGAGQGQGGSPNLHRTHARMHAHTQQASLTHACVVCTTPQPMRPDPPNAHLPLHHTRTHERTNERLLPSDPFPIPKVSMLPHAPEPSPPLNPPPLPPPPLLQPRSLSTLNPHLPSSLLLPSPPPFLPSSHQRTCSLTTLNPPLP